LPDLLYLDTARLGRMSPAAQRAQHDYVSLAGEEGSSAYFERFVRHGLAACPSAMQVRYPGLAHWQGVAELKRALRIQVGHRPDLPVLVAHRSAQLMKLTARVLFYPCRNVLVTDLGWPGYHAILEQEACRAGRSVTTVAVRDEVLSGRLGETELIDRVCEAYVRKQCDGLFLTAVSNWGVRFPVEPVVRRLETSHLIWAVAVDGAQDFCHTPGRLEAEYCDLYLTGCHKWLSAHHPMGLAFYGRRRSSGLIDTILSRMRTSGDLDDPLLRFSGQLETGGLDGVTETVNLLPLFSARAAVEDTRIADGFCCRSENLRTAAAVAQVAGWRPLLPDGPLRSGILLLKAERPAACATSPDSLRATLRDAGVSATTYEGGLIRLSMPLAPFTSDELGCLGQALQLAS
jgi:hypothetical protein